MKIRHIQRDNPGKFKNQTESNSGSGGQEVAPPPYGLEFMDNQEHPLQLSEDTKASGSPTDQAINQTGLPDDLKAGVENLSGYSLDDVNVHYNSDKPAQIQAHAFAQGTDIHLAPSQEKHLPHEAWHVVQQKQGRVQPTRQLGGKVNINDEVGLEKEADVMGKQAQGVTGYTHSAMEVDSHSNERTIQNSIAPIQGIFKKLQLSREGEWWKDEDTGRYYQFHSYDDHGNLILITEDKEEKVVINENGEELTRTSAEAEYVAIDDDEAGPAEARAPVLNPDLLYIVAENHNKSEGERDKERIFCRQQGLPYLQEKELKTDDGDSADPGDLRFLYGLALFYQALSKAKTLIYERESTKAPKIVDLLNNALVYLERILAEQPTGSKETDIQTLLLKEQQRLLFGLRPGTDPKAVYDLIDELFQKRVMNSFLFGVTTPDLVSRQRSRSMLNAANGHETGIRGGTVWMVGRVHVQHMLEEARHVEPHVVIIQEGEWLQMIAGGDD